MSLYDPLYSIRIEEIHSEQTLFRGLHSGLLVPLLHGMILDHARITDAGERLEYRKHLKFAFRDGGFPLPKTAFRDDDNVLPIAR